MTTNKLTPDTHDLFYDLDAFDQKWQDHYPTIRRAAEAAQVLPMYYDWLTTASGQKYQRSMQGVPDTLGTINRARELEAASAVPFKLSGWDKRWETVRGAMDIYVKY